MIRRTLTVTVKVGSMELTASGPPAEVGALYAKFMAEVNANIARVTEAMQAATRRTEVAH